jgi:hypothetical protein
MKTITLAVEPLGVTRMDISPARRSSLPTAQAPSARGRRVPSDAAKENMNGNQPGQAVDGPQSVRIAPTATVKYRWTCRGGNSWWYCDTPSNKWKRLVVEGLTGTATTAQGADGHVAKE